MINLYTSENQESSFLSLCSDWLLAASPITDGHRKREDGLIALCRLHHRQVIPSFPSTEGNEDIL